MKLSAWSVLGLVVLSGCFDPSDESEGTATGTGTTGGTSTAAATGQPPTTGSTSDPTAGSVTGDPTSGPATETTPTTDDPTTGEDESSGGSDTTAPTVVSILPADDATGVDADAEIVITFSEPMAQATAQAAYQSADIPAASVTFGWNPAGDELTITPTASLAYAEGASSARVVALEYAFELTSTATDLADNPLAEAVDSSFSTSRQITQSLSADDNLSGDIDEDGSVSANGRAGDFNANTQVRGFYSYDLSTLPGDAELTAASFRSNQLILGGHDPYGSLGGVLNMHRVSYATLVGATFDTAIVSSIGAIATDPGPVDADVTDAATAASEAGELLQLRTTFPIATDGDNGPDVTLLLPMSAILELVYLIP